MLFPRRGVALRGTGRPDEPEVAHRGDNPTRRGSKAADPGLRNRCVAAEQAIWLLMAFRTLGDYMIGVIVAFSAPAAPAYD